MRAATTNRAAGTNATQRLERANPSTPASNVQSQFRTTAPPNASASTVGRSPGNGAHTSSQPSEGVGSNSKVGEGPAQL